KMEQILGGDIYIIALPVDLIWSLAQHRSEFLGADINQTWMCDPGTIETVSGFALLICFDFFYGILGRFWFIPVRDERRHAADGECATFMARMNQKVGIGAHHRCRHRYIGTIRKDEFFAGFAEGLDY